MIPKDKFLDIKPNGVPTNIPPEPIYKIIFVHGQAQYRFRVFFVLEENKGNMLLTDYFYENKQWLNLFISKSTFLMDYKCYLMELGCLKEQRDRRAGDPVLDFMSRNCAHDAISNLFFRVRNSLWIWSLFYGVKFEQMTWRFYGALVHGNSQAKVNSFGVLTYDNLDGASLFARWS